MVFSDEVIRQAWQRAGDNCERCNKALLFASRGKELEGGWEAHHKIASGPDTLANCEILCQPCHKNTKSYGG